MLHFFSILTPARRDAVGQKTPFFSDDAKLSPAERDAEFLNGKRPAPDEQLNDRDETYHHTRFVSLLTPPFF